MVSTTAQRLPIAAPRPGARAPVRQRRLHLHGDFVQWLADAPHGQRAAALRALEGIVAHGRPNRVKSCKGANAGWLRTPVGGTSGKQYYLWFAGSGSAPVGDRLRRSEWLVRAVRHHDKTDAVIGAGDDWMPWTPSELLEEVDRDHHGDFPLSAAQKRAAASSAPMQIVLGRPGAGKTTTLLHATRNLPGRVLYLTFGAALAARAREWFGAFLEDADGIEVLSFGDLLARLGRLPERGLRDPDPRARQDILTSALSRQLGQLGPWVRDGALRAHDLYDELHAHFYGWSPLEWNEEAYLARRAGAIGAEAASAAASVAVHLCGDARRRLFPGPMAARDVLGMDRAGLSVPWTIDWLVVDEVQDLTVVELEVLTVFLDELARRQRRRPGVRIAGDEGQTLRPTAFSWSTLKERLAPLGPIEEQALVSNLRSSNEVVDFVRRLTVDTYRGKLPKELRPGGQYRSDQEPVEGGQCLLLQSDAPLEQLVASVGRHATVVEVGRPVDSPVERAARSVDARYFTSETAKGLDFETVAIFGLGAALREMQALRSEGETERAALERLRLLADHARVASSRAVSRLVIVETDPAAADAVARMYEAHALEGAASALGRIPVGDIESHLEVDSGDAVGLMIDSLRLCEELVERDPHEALRHAEAAFSAFSKAGRSQAVGDELRRRIHLMRARIRFVLAVPPMQSDRGLKLAEDDFREAGETSTSSAISWLREIEKKTSAESLATALGQWRWVTADTLDPGVAGLLATRFESSLAALCERVASADTPVGLSQARALAKSMELMVERLAHRAPTLPQLVSRVLGTLAESRVDAGLVLDHLGRLPLPDGATLRAMALDTLDVDAAVEAWVSASAPDRAVAFLRRRGDPGRALEVAGAHGLEPDAGLMLLVRLLDDLSALRSQSPDSLTEGERATLRRSLPNWLVRDGDRRARHSA